MEYVSSVRCLQEQVKKLTKEFAATSYRVVKIVKNARHVPNLRISSSDKQ